MEEKIRHLEMVQGIINRMAGNSFFLKGWMVTLVTAFFLYRIKMKILFIFSLSIFQFLSFGCLTPTI